VTTAEVGGPGAPPLQINAWLPGTHRVEAAPAAAVGDWAIRRSGTLVPNRPLAATEPADERDWWDERVGWGLVLPDDDAVPTADRAAGADAAPALRRLLAARPGSPVLRYRPEHGVSFLVRYDEGGTARKIATTGGERGTAPRRLPKYLLIAASPAQVPWRLQYLLNTSSYVGRLDLPDDGLERYVDALVAGWDGATARPRSTVVWSVDHGKDDITWLMRHGLAEPLADTWAGDDDLRDGLHRLTGDAASGSALVDALATRRPGVVVTTSHGVTSPLDDPEALRAGLGVMVDGSHQPIDAEGLAQAWDPDGALWYSHACCSAGADGTTLFADVVDPGSDVERVLTGVTTAGACTAPLPRALLGAERPLRAFVGHVEPTFNWTLRDPENGQLLTAGVRTALYDGLFRARPEPIGLALARAFAPVAALWSRWDTERHAAVGGDATARRRALSARLSALDRQSIVVLGDPTAVLPALADSPP
jgi:hypothetical protein